MIDNIVLDKLEFGKVLQYVAKYSTTELGRQLVLESRPLDSLDQVIEKGRHISEAKEILIKNDIPPLEYLPDLFEPLSRSSIEGSVLPKNVILDILKLAETSRRLYQFLKSHDESNLITTNLSNNLFVDKVFEHHISKVFTENGDIRNDASDKLREIRKNIREKSESLRKTVNKVLKQFSESYLVREEYITQRDGRIVIPVKAEHKRHVKGFIHSESATGQTVYIEPEETLELNNEILSLMFAEKREVERILKSLTSKIGESSGELKKSLRYISEIDLIFSNARYSIEVIGEFPSFDKNKPLSLMDARHPILIKRLGRKETVPLNLKLDQENIIIITGPNAGGKTVVLKTVGLLMIMAASGMHVPVQADSNFHLFDKVLVDIGDEQSIEDDLSTFSSHLSNIKNILEVSDEKSLILVDEIGTGTDPQEGSALATAILLNFNKKKSKVLATTHHGILKVIANDEPGFQNASMEFDKKKLQPTYKFKQGIPGSSYAFEVAERIGFDKLFTDLAKEYLDSDKNKLEDFLIELEEKSKDLQENLSNAQTENLRLKGLTNLYQDRIDKLEKQKKEIIKETKDKADSYLDKINKEFEQTIKRIKESQAQKEVIVEEKRKIEELKISNRNLIAETDESEEPKNVKLEIGSFVSVIDTTTTGEIIEMNHSKDKAVINSGSVRLQVKISNLLPASKKKSISHTYHNHDFTPQVHNYRLDIRGKKPEEIEFEVIRFIDDAYATSQKNIEILHGKGTGVLKTTVWDLLKKHESVKDFQFAKIEMGGEGITIVELK